MLAPLLRVRLLILASMCVVSQLLAIFSLRPLFKTSLEVVLLMLLMVWPVVRLTSLILILMRMMLPYTAILRTVVLLRRNLCGNGLGLRGG
jgi:hypothetical protein